MEKNNLKGKKFNLNEKYNQNINKREKKFIVKIPLELNSYSEDELIENFCNSNNNLSKFENTITNNQNKNEFKSTTRFKHYIKDKTISIPFNNNLHNTLKQSNSNNNYIRKISNTKEEFDLNNEKNEANKINNNKYAKIKNPKKKKDINLNKGNKLKYKSIKNKLENNGNSNAKGKICENNLVFNKYIKEENKMINYNYFVLNPKNINNNKKIENNLIQNIIKYPINKSVGNNNIYINRINSQKKLKEKDLYICLRNSFFKQKENEKNNNLTNSQEFLYTNILSQNKSLKDSLCEQKNNINTKMNKQHNKQFSRTFVDIKDIKTIECQDNTNNNIEEDINNNITKQNKKNAKSYKKKYLNLNNSISQNKNFAEEKNRVKKKDISLKIFLDKNMILNSINNKFENNSTINNNNNKILRTSIAYQTKENIQKHSYNNSSNNTINAVSGNKTMLNKDMNIPSMQNIRNKNLSLNQKEIVNKPNKKSKLIIYKKRKISNHKCQSKRKNEIENNYINKNKSNYLTENKSIKMNQLNKFIQLSKNMKKIELFKDLNNEKNNLTKNNNNDNYKDNNNKDQKQYIYMKSILTKWKNNTKNISSYSNKRIISPNKKVINISSFNKKFYNFIIKKCIPKLCLIVKRHKFRPPVNKLCIFSKNIILKENNNKINHSNIDEGNNTIMELNSSKFSKLNNTNKNIEIIEDGEDNDNEDFNVEEYEKNNIINNSNFNNLINEENINNINNSTKGKHIFKIQKRLQKLCRIFFRNLEIKKKKKKRK